MKKLFTLLLAVAASVGTMFADGTKIGDLYYNLNATNQTAEVTHQNSTYPFWSTTITTAIIPASVTYKSVTYSVTSIGNYAFYDCTGLTSVTIGNSVTSIGDYAFYYCTGLTSVTIPNSVTSIGRSAFGNCHDLTSVTIPNSVTSIGHLAFEGCRGLTSVTIPNSVTSIGNSAFDGCKGLTSVTIGSGVTSIGSSAFVGCTALTTVSIPNSVTSIGSSAFYGCSSLTSVTIPNSVTNIGDWAFYCCSSLTSVTIPNSVTSIGDDAFYGCTGLTSINVASDNSNYYSVDGVLFNKDKTTLIQYPGGKQGAYTIPNSVTSIGSSAFSGCSGLTSVTIGNSVTSIGNYAFYGCTGLTSVTIGNSVTSIGEWAFAWCTGLTSVTIGNSVTSIGNSAFYGCEGLTFVTIESDAIVSKAYTYDTNLKNIFGDQVKEYIIGNSVTSIGDDAFADCSGLTSITIPNSVTSIEWEAFRNCTGLTSVTIPNSVTSIGNWAFEGCSGLTSVTCFATTLPGMGENVFVGVDKSIPLYVPAGSVSAYRSAYQWENFTNILPIGAQPADVTTTTVTPSAMTADIAWPQVTGTATYTIEIKKNGELIYTLTFNAQGLLISIASNAPSRNNAPQQTQAAGFAFTVTSLDSGTTYSYTMAAKDNNGNVLKTESGTFTTTGESQGFEDVQGNNVQCTKVVRGGQIFILRGDKTYTLQGQEVK